MYESAPYRDELANYSASFATRRHRQQWRDDSLSKAERMLFVGFLFVRKLIECRKVTDACARSSAPVLRAQIRRKREVSHFQPHDLFKDLDQAEWGETKIDVHQLADKVIHAWWIVPVQSEEKGLDGFIFTTDRHRNTELWRLPTESVVEIFSRFAGSPITQLEARRDALGKLTYWRAQ